MKKKRKEGTGTLFAAYPMENFDVMCSEVWPIVSDYFIKEIDNNSSLLKDSIDANTLSQCVHYICTEEEAARFRNARSVFSVLVRLHQTEKISTSKLQQAFIDNSELLEWWFGILILHADKNGLENISLMRFVSSFTTKLISREDTRAVKKTGLKKFSNETNDIIDDSEDKSIQNIEAQLLTSSNLTVKENNILNSIKEQLVSSNDIKITENLDSLLNIVQGIIPGLYESKPIDKVGEVFEVIAKIESISSQAADIVWNALKPETPTYRGKRLQNIFDRNQSTEGFDYNDGVHYVVKLNIPNFFILNSIVVWLEQMPQSEFVCRFREDFEPMLNEKKKQITLDLEGPELFALRAVFTMMIYYNPDNEILVTEIEKLLFKDIGNAKKL